MERDILQCDIPNILMYRPSLNYGNRNEQRFTEAIGTAAVKILQFVMIGKLKKYRAITGKDVAKALFIGVYRKGYQIIFSDDF